MSSYYFTEDPVEGVHTVAFPPGFRMIAGNSLKRKYFGQWQDQVKPPSRKTWTEADMIQQSRLETVLGFNCLHYGIQNEGSMERHEMPDKNHIDQNCFSGLRAEIMFPSCWNGELDSDNHMDHVAYPADRRNGACPEGYEQRLPAVFYEIIYQTPLFKGLPGDFVFSNGDASGNGFHGDFVNGWEDGVLQQVIDSPVCTGFGSLGQAEECPLLKLKGEAECVACKMEIPEILQHEPYELVNALPGNVKVVAGVDFVPAPVHDSTSTVSSSPSPASETTSDVETEVSTNTTMLPVYTNSSALATSTEISSSSTSYTISWNDTYGQSTTSITTIPSYNVSTSQSTSLYSPSTFQTSLLDAAPSSSSTASLSLVFSSSVVSSSAILSSEFNATSTTSSVLSSITSGPAVNAGGNRTIDFTSTSTRSDGLLIEYDIEEVLVQATVYVDQFGRPIENSILGAILATMTSPSAAMTSLPPSASLSATVTSSTAISTESSKHPVKRHGHGHRRFHGVAG
jgi:hypothetical protein